MAVILLLVVALGHSNAQLSTEDHVSGPGFWPTKAQPSLTEFVGEGACAKCHSGIATTQLATSMARTAMPASTAEILHRQPDLSFQFDKDTYRVHGAGSGGTWQSRYSVGDGAQTLEFPLAWAFGTGRVGQSYLFKKDDGHFYEARVTWFKSLHGIGFTPARALSGPVDLEQAMSRPVGEPELIRCFSCHATAVNIADSFNEKSLVAGVQCEACHGPGATHVRLMQTPGAAAGKAGDDVGTFSPSRLSPTESVEYCGACHGSFWDVKLAHVTGPSSVRSAPYRLVTSKCWGKDGDPRLVCTACHDPHRELVTEATAYDAACLRCHAGGAAGAHGVQTAVAAGHPGVCPVATSKCTTCHMPKVYVPEMHDNFTDHRIRIVKAGEAFPE